MQPRFMRKEVSAEENLFAFVVVGDGEASPAAATETEVKKQNTIKTVKEKFYFSRRWQPQK